MLRYISLSALIVLFLSAAAPPQHLPATKMIYMKGMKFVPNKIEISIGDTVIWMNESGGDHNVVASDGSFKSNMLEKGKFYALVFSKKGQYKYFCQPHKIMGMKGTIEVKD